MVHRRKIKNQFRQKPILGQQRRLRLSKLFRRTGYNRNMRDGSKKDGRRREESGGSGGSGGSIELFDSMNYFGPTTGKFF